MSRSIFTEFEVNFKLIIPITDHETTATIAEVLKYCNNEWDLGMTDLVVTQRPFGE